MSKYSEPKGPPQSGYLPVLARARPAMAGETTMEPMLKWLAIGVGDITTKRVLPAILAEPRSTLAGVVTRDPAKAEPYRVPAWPDVDAALTACAAEAVYLATPVFLHAPQTIAALRAGRHVLCEKPVAMNFEEAAGMTRAARETGNTLG